MRTLMKRLGAILNFSQVSKFALILVSLNLLAGSQIQPAFCGASH